MTDILNYDIDSLNSEEARWQRREEQYREAEKRFPDLYKIPPEEVYRYLVAMPQKPLQPFELNTKLLKSHKNIDGNEKL